MYVQYTAKDYLKYFGLPADYSVDGILVVGSWNTEAAFKRVIELVEEHWPQVRVEKLPVAICHQGFAFLSAEKTIWFFVEYGGARLSELLHIGSLLGSKRNLLTGLTGGLKPGLKTGDIIIPSKSYKDGSMSQLYSKNQRLKHEPADEDLVHLLLNKLGAQALIGKSMTCQAMLAESWSMISDWSKAGYFGVEMEAATLFAVSNYFAVSSAAMLVVSDNLIEGTQCFR